MDAKVSTRARPRRVFVALPEEEFNALAAVAEREVRTPDQQATHLIRLALRKCTEGKSRSLAGAAA